MQEILDCDSGNKACKGGNPYKVFDYINDYGISYEDNYKYTFTAGQCREERNKRFEQRMKYYFVENPVELILALQKGPVVIIHHVNKIFKNYKKGVFNDKNCKGKLNHAGLAVGYNLEG